MDDQRNHKLYPSPFAFRLIYNGQVITQKVPGCTKTQELCDISHFMRRVSSMAAATVDCVDVTYESASPKQVLHELLTTTGGIVLALLIVAASALVASVAVFYQVMGVVPSEQDMTNLKDKVVHAKGEGSGRRQKGHQRLATSDEDDDDDFGEDGIVLSRLNFHTDDDLEFNISDASPMEE